MTVIGIPIHAGINDESLISIIQILRSRLHSKNEDLMKSQEYHQENLEYMHQLEWNNKKLSEKLNLLNKKNQILINEITIQNTYNNGKNKILYLKRSASF